MSIVDRLSQLETGYTGDRYQDNANDAIKDILAFLRGCPFISGVEVPFDDEFGQPNVARASDGRLVYQLAAGATDFFSHRLGRIPRGFWAVVNFGWSPAIEEIYDVNTDRRKKLKLRNNAGTTHSFRLWVY